MDKREASERKRVPNQRLREERERRGLAHRDVAEYIGLPDPHTVGRWERGVSFPHPHYRQKLCQLFGKSAEELGLFKGPSAEDGQQSETASSLSKQLADLEYTWKVPRPFTSFVGRERDVSAVRALLVGADVRLVTLLGPGGVGKTRLSIQVAATLDTFFADGACFVSLAEIDDPTLVFPTIAHALGLQESGMPSIVEQMKSVLRAKHFLLILDNFEQVMAAALLVEELLAACPNLKILVTSRAVLHLQGEHEYPVAPLALPAADAPPTLESLTQYSAIALFVQRAQTFLPAFQATESNIQAIAEICARLDGLPLALELAAARIKLLPPNALLARLPQGLQFLKSELQNQTERQSTLHNTIKWSYDLLSAREQWLFRHLAVFPGGCSLETVEEIFGAGPAPDILDTVASLLDKSLLQQVERDEEVPRLVMLATMREYGLACLQAQGEKEEGQRSQAMHYFALAQQAGPFLNGEQQTQWLARLEREKENLRAAMSYFLQSAQADLALHLCEPFGKFCGLRGYWSEEQHWLSAALSLPWSASSAGIRARVLRRAGHLTYRRRDLSTARGILEESIALSRSVGDKQNLAGALVSQGWVLYRQQDLASAGQLLRESVAAARESGDSWAIANSLESLGRLVHLQGDADEARRLLDESVALARELRDKENLARTLTTLVSLEIAQGNIARAALLAQESYDLAQKLGTRPLQALTLDSLGNVALFRGEYERAAQLLEQRLRIAREFGDMSTIVIKRLIQADIALARDDLARAAALAQESLYSFREQGDRPNIAGALSILGDVERTRGEFARAVACYQEALLLSREVGHRRGIGRALSGLAMVLLAQRQAEQATRLFGFVEAWMASPGNRHPAQQLAYEQALEQARSQLAARTFAAAWSEGRALAFDEALALAFPVN